MPRSSARPSDLVLRRPDPLAAQLDDVLGVLADRLAQGPAADSVPGLEHPHVEPRDVELARRGQPGEARTDDNDVTVMHRLKYPASVRDELPAGLGEDLGVAVHVGGLGGRRHQRHVVERGDEHAAVEQKRCRYSSSSRVRGRVRASPPLRGRLGQEAVLRAGARAG